MSIFLFCIAVVTLLYTAKRIGDASARLEKALLALQERQPDQESGGYRDAPPAPSKSPPPQPEAPQPQTESVRVVQASSLKKFEKHQKCRVCGRGFAWNERACDGCICTLSDNRTPARIEGLHLHFECIGCRSPGVRAPAGE